METTKMNTNDTAAEIAAMPETLAETLPAVRVAEPINTQVMPGFTTGANWELAQRIAKAFAASDMVPQSYRGNVQNCIIALDMANRMGASPFMVMQNLYIVHGTPGWSSKFLIASFNQSGRFSAIRYEWSADRSECTAWAIEKATGERIIGPKVTMEIAKAEGWSTKNGSKWKTMPDLMLMYRAAAFLVRTYAPEIAMGFLTAEEAEDIAPAKVAPAVSIRFSPAQMAQAKAEIASGNATAEGIAERFPTLAADQIAELKSVNAQ